MTSINDKTLETNPIEQAKAATPWWMMEILRFDGLEIHPVAEYTNKMGSFCEVCAAEDAQFWSVYGHCKTGGVECFEDLDSEAEAIKFADRLLEAYPHLQEYGLTH